MEHNKPLIVQVYWGKKKYIFWKVWRKYFVFCERKFANELNILENTVKCYKCQKLALYSQDEHFSIWFI